MPKQMARLALLAILLGGWGLYLWGIVRDLPYEPFIDEPIFVERAVHMAATGELNPGWFGNPGSTTIYPLAAIYYFWFAVTEGGNLLRPDPRLAADFAADFSIYYLIGRLLTIAYGLLTVAVTFVLGRKMGGTAVGLLASLSLIFYPTLAWHTTVVRSDTSAMFFVALALWFCYQTTDEPRLRHFVLAGSAMGLALSSRYLMIPVYFVYLTFFLLHLPRWRQNGEFALVFRGFLIGGLVSVAVFALSSPFFFLDWNTAWQNLSMEARSTHLGADGKNFWERAVWYLTSAIPESIYGAQVIALLVGIGWAVYQRKRRLLVLAVFLLVYVAAISIPALHWKRWTIQISPILALLAAYGIDTTAAALGERLAPLRRMAIALLLGAVVLVQPVYTTARVVIQLGATSTRIEARLWIEENLPAGSRIIGELYTAPLQKTSFVVTTQPFLPERPFADYLSGAFDYVMTSSEISNRFVADPERYALQLAFYAQLSELPLVQEFVPNPWQGGPSIRIFRLPNGQE